MEKFILKNDITKETYEISNMKDFIGLLNTGVLILSNDENSPSKVVKSNSNNFETIKEKKQKNGSPRKNANGDGSFYYSDKLQKWVGQYGRKTVTQRKNETKTQCKERWEKLKSQIKEGTYIEKTKDSLYSILDRNVEQKYKDGTTNGSSYLRNVYTLKQLKEICSDFIDKPIQKVTIDDIEKSKEIMREYSTECINKMWGMLRLGFRIAFSRRLLVYNIMEDITLKKPISKKPKTKKEALTRKEEQKLRDILNNEEKEHEYRDIVLMQLNSGMRIGEVLSREINDFDLELNTQHIWNTVTRDKKGYFIIGEHTKNYNKTLQVDKGERTIPLDNETREIVVKKLKSNMRNIHNLLFWDYKNNCLITYKEINSWLKRLNSKYKITNKSLSSHILRHTRITRLREANVPLPVIQYTVGQIEGSDVTDEVYVTISLDFATEELKKANMI